MKSGLKQPQPPSEAREGPPRPQANGRYEAEDVISLPTSEFYRICKELRINKLSGPPAADALEAAAGLLNVASPQGAKPKELRSKVHSAREDEGGGEGGEVVEAEPEKPKKPKKKGMCFAQEEPEEIPEIPETPAAEVEEEPAEAEGEKKEIVPNLNPKQNKIRSDLEMWVMDELPQVYGVGDSEELDESLQEDAQADKITELIAEAPSLECGHTVKWKKAEEGAGKCDKCKKDLAESEPLLVCKKECPNPFCLDCAAKDTLVKRKAQLDAWLVDGEVKADVDAKKAFVDEICSKMAEIDDAEERKAKVLGKGKKKKKKP